jgi:hypothetical protein
VEASRLRGALSLSQSSHDSIQERVKKQFKLKSQRRILLEEPRILATATASCAVH